MQKADLHLQFLRQQVHHRLHPSSSSSSSSILLMQHSSEHAQYCVQSIWNLLHVHRERSLNELRCKRYQQLLFKNKILRGIDPKRLPQADQQRIILYECSIKCRNGWDTVWMLWNMVGSVWMVDCIIKQQMSVSLRNQISRS